MLLAEVFRPILTEVPVCHLKNVVEQLAAPFYGGKLVIISLKREDFGLAALEALSADLVIFKGDDLDISKALKM